jgi:hypothetical protein
VKGVAASIVTVKGTHTKSAIPKGLNVMGRYDSRIAKMIDLSTSLAACRHTALLIAESMLVCEDPTRRKQGSLDHLQSTIERLEIAVETERRSESFKVIASEMRRSEEAPRPLAPPVLWA